MEGWGWNTKPTGQGHGNQQGKTEQSESLNSIKQRKMNIVGQSQQELDAVKTGAE